MRPSLRFTIVAAAALLLVLAVSAAAAPTAPARLVKQPKIRTLVAESGSIRAFAQDTNSLAWIGKDYRVHVRSLSIGRSAIVGSAAPPGGGPPPSLALAGTRALWTKFEGGNAPETSLWSAALGESPFGIDLFSGESGEPGGILLGGMAGDGQTLLYGKTFEGCSPPPWPPAPCPTLEATGGVSFVTGEYEQSPMSGIPPSAMLAFAAHDPGSGRISQGRLAVVPAASPVSTNLDKVPRAAEDGPVQVYWFLNHLVLASTAVPRGTVKAIALSFDRLAVLIERPDETKAVDRYAARGGALLGTTAVPKATASILSSSSAGVIYRVGKSIYAIRAGASKLVWKATSMPIGLSIEGRRIAWAENVKGRGRIVALTLPR